MKRIIFIGVGLLLFFMLVLIFLALALIGMYAWSNIFHGDGRDE